jgi:hypothetical protein
MNDSEIGCEDTVYKLVGFDAAGARRVYAADYTKAEAQRKCLNAATDYVRSHLDTGPLTSWHYEWK